MDLLPFQTQASDALASRIQSYLSDPNAPMETRTRLVPLFQNLGALTGAGKTVILADAAERLRERLGVQPIVLWISKGKVVVEQTLANLDGGKYKDLIPGYSVKALLECSKADVEEGPALMLLATVATFNQTDQARRVFKLALDKADKSLWDLLRTRENADGDRRHLFVIYDEGHNLTDQQTDLLLDLEPDAIVSATATPRFPQRLFRICERLRDAGWGNDKLRVDVEDKSVVDAALVKSHLILSGFDTTAEAAVDELLRDMAAVDKVAKSNQLTIKPKAIYVCATNTFAGTGRRPVRDDPKQPFKTRRAPPIVIWRYLTETKKVSPSEIAVYCGLDVHKDYPLPKSFNLFRGGDKDYAAFRAGGYRHIIFNLSLQEGWDDPECYFAYIDKTMGSPLQVEQVIGRVLRQPGGKHYEDVRLNSASFYVRLDDRSVFLRILEEVKAAVETSAPQVAIHAFEGAAKKKAGLLAPRVEATVPRVSVNASAARREIRKIMNAFIDYRGDSVNTKGVGARVKVRRRIGAAQNTTYQWVETNTAHKVTTRAIFVRKLLSIYPRALHVCDVEDARLDAEIEANSPAAAEVASRAASVANAFLKDSVLVQKSSDVSRIGPALVDVDKRITFVHSLHAAYSGLNSFELAFAGALDMASVQWTRNAPRSGYGIPLLHAGSTKTFYPDFLVWKHRYVFAIDTKGDHILLGDACHKLLDVEQVGRGVKLLIRFVAQGQWTDLETKTGKEGYTVFKMRNGKAHASAVSNIEEAVRKSLKP